jgi:hypothetical protein
MHTGQEEDMNESDEDQENYQKKTSGLPSYFESNLAASKRHNKSRLESASSRKHLQAVNLLRRSRKQTHKKSLRRAAEEADDDFYSCQQSDEDEDFQSVLDDGGDDAGLAFMEAELRQATDADNHDSNEFFSVRDEAESRRMTLAGGNSTIDDGGLRASGASKAPEEPVVTVFDRILSQRSSIETKGMNVMFINDSDQVFCPVLQIGIPVCFGETFGNPQLALRQEYQVQAKVLYYNSSAGEWEPFIESLYIKAAIDEYSQIKRKITSISMPRAINVNISESLLQIYFETMNTWE